MARRSSKIKAAVVLLAIFLFMWTSSVVLRRDGTLRDLPKNLMEMLTEKSKTKRHGGLTQFLQKEMFQHSKLGLNHTKQDPTVLTTDKVQQAGLQPNEMNVIRILNAPSYDKEEQDGQSEISNDVTEKQPMPSEWEVEQTRRKSILKDACARHPELNMSTATLSRNPHLLWPFIYDDKYKVIYCSICKVASTTWKSVFLVLMGTYNSIQDVDLRLWPKLQNTLHTLKELGDADEIEKRLRTYKKFIFVREPFSRELSGYRNKLFKRNRYFEKLVGTEIIKEFRQNPDRHALATGIGVTFTEFVMHLTKTRTESLNVHWRPMYTMVLPCAVEFDYIGHLETTEEDTENILVKTGLNEVVEIPPVTANLSNSDEIFNQFYQQLDNSLLRDMYNTLKLDLELFGYKPPELVARKINLDT